jgi:hypothetical protein
MELPMRQLTIPIMLAGGLALGGCAQILPIAIGTAVNHGVGAATRAAADGMGNGSPSQQQQVRNAAANACGQRAAQHGQVTISDVQQAGNDTLRVYGIITANGSNEQRAFTCAFRTSDGQIIEFI